MGFFTFFGAPSDDVKGSYCDTDSESDVEYYEGDEIEEQMQSACDRNDTVEFSEADFDDSAVTQRYDDDARQIEQGPREYGPQKRWYQL